MSCLVEKLSYYVDLSAREDALLRQMEEAVEAYKKREIILKPGEASDHVYVVRKGWVVNYTELPSGGRLILNIHMPGDLIGGSTLPFKQSVCGLMAASATELCPFPKAGVKEVLRESAKLSALLFAMAMQENVVLIDRMKAIGRMEGPDRLLLLLLQLWARLKVTDRHMINDFDLPLSQEIIADALGITTVYTNKMLKQLQEDMLIMRKDKRITLLRIDEMKERCGFEDRYYELDTSWYPQPD
ncbi:MAG: hypothetical protein CMM93_07430 [Rickettsiales bacterium]|mgnify:CR=1 FL=1|nr:hypothetical protein [Rickettsiales bacterium]|tara:strand:- start:372 stop:1100 length:729 start_codon:yes stop_codon:yes gene_type:complete